MDTPFHTPRLHLSIIILDSSAWDLDCDYLAGFYENPGETVAAARLLRVHCCTYENSIDRLTNFNPPYIAARGPPFQAERHLPRERG